ncbi:unnamed protein product [Closterium sp. NIES-64]|nr:unnamed protein product [Closterium sp. NIES-64]
MSLGGTTGDNTRLLGQAPEEEEEMEAEGVKEVAVATSLEVLYQETPNYRGAVAEVDHMIDPRETARHAWRVPDLGVDPAVSAGEEAVRKDGDETKMGGVGGGKGWESEEGALRGWGEKEALRNGREEGDGIERRREGGEGGRIGGRAGGERRSGREDWVGMMEEGEGEREGGGEVWGRAVVGE